MTGIIMEQPIRVLNLFMVLDRGGAETIVMNVYRHLDRSKVQFDFLVHGDEEGAYEREIRELGGRIYRLPKLGLGSLYRCNKMLSNFFAAHPEYKIVHAHNSELGLFALRQAKLSGVPCRICHAHSAPNSLARNSFLRYLFKKLTLLYITDQFACSEAAGEWQFGNHSHFRQINNGIEIEKFRYQELRRNELKKQMGLSEHFIVGHIGRFALPKNHFFLLKVFRQILKRKPNAILLLLGDGPMKGPIEDEVAKMNLSYKVIFAGARENIADYLQIFDVFVFPSLFEGLGIVAIEAQAAGVPCFCSEAVPRQVALTNGCFFLPLQSPEEWANKILSAKLPDRNVLDSGGVLRRAGYDIKETALTLEKFYLSRV